MAKEAGRKRLTSLEEGDASTALTKNEIVPDVLDVAPSAKLQVVYSDALNVEFGNSLTPHEVCSKPTFLSWPAEEGNLYALVMTDPDAPSRGNPKYREFRHWLVFNIPGTNVADGTEAVEYMGARPPQGTGLHRYVFLVYKQGHAIAVNPKDFSSRPKTSTRTLVEEFNLGAPVAGNFFQAQHDGTY